MAAKHRDRISRSAGKAAYKPAKCRDRSSFATLFSLLLKLQFLGRLPGSRKAEMRSAQEVASDATGGTL